MPRKTFLRIRANERAELQSLGNWYLKLFPAYTYVPYQQEIVIPKLERWIRREGKRKLAILIAAGHAKTDMGTRALIPMYLGQNPGHTAMTLSYADGLAKKFGRFIRNTCESDLARQLWPKVRPRKDSRSVQNFTTEQDNEYSAVGFDGVISGNRLDYLGIDDPCKSLSEANSEAFMATRFDIYRSTADARLKPGGLVGMVLTRFGTRDFFARVMEYEGDEWDVLLVPAENADGRYLWEDHYGREKYESIKRKDPEMWNAMWMQAPEESNRHFFSDTLIHFYEPNEVKRGWATYMITDPAKGLGKNHNFTSIVVLAAGPEHKLYVVDWVFDHLDPDQRSAACCRLIRKWKVRRWIYEQQGLVNDIFYLNKDLEREKLSIRPIEVGRKGPRAYKAKQDRIRELQSDFRAGTLLFPRSLMYTCVNGEPIDVIRKIINEEILPYRGEGTVKHDDGLDTLSRIHDPELRPDYIPLPSADLRAVYQTPGTWESVW